MKSNNTINRTNSTPINRTNTNPANRTNSSHANKAIIKPADRAFANLSDRISGGRFSKKILTQKAYGFFDKVVTILYPRHCPFCDRIVPYGSMAHEQCRRKAEYADSYETCIKCGKPLLYGHAEYCRDCLKGGHVFDYGMSLYNYRTVSGSIYRFKYDGRQEYADFYAGEIERHLGSKIRALKPDALIPVPMYKGKKNKRGYNQAEVLAKAIGRKMNIPVRCDIIERVRDTTPMKELSASERHVNLKKAFNIVQNDVKLKNIIIIDDIYTTGSTVDHMTWQLKKGPASSVYVLTLAIGQTA